jgi:5,10-methylenetetrahydromethanopterin reductase
MRPPEHCVERLGELINLGLGCIVVVSGSWDADPDVVAASNELFATEVLPELRPGNRPVRRRP